jgi:hypothetical protein
MLAYLFLLFAVAARMPFMPHPWGFAPVAAALLYFGARGARRQLWLPVTLLIASDIALNKYVYSYPLTWDLMVTWAWYAGIAWLGTRLTGNTTLRTKKDWLRVGGASLASSVSFFIVSNFAVWASYATYPKTLAGLVACYDAGIPFFRRGLEGDLLYTALMFGVPAAAALLAGSETPSGAAAA